MSARGRLEAQLTAEALWSVSITTSGTESITALASAASAYPTDLLAAFAAALTAGATAGTWTVTGSFGESGTGKVTIDCTSTPWSLSWTSTNLRTALGFAANITSVSAAQTGTSHAKGVWLPDCPMWSTYGPQDDGGDRSDAVHTVSPRGDVLTLTSQRYTDNAVKWSHVSRARARRAGESVTSESFQQWWRDCYLGELAYCDPGPKVRLIWSADASAVYTEYRIADLPDAAPPVAVNDWNGLFTIDLPKLIKVP